MTSDMTSSRSLPLVFLYISVSWLCITGYRRIIGTKKRRLLLPPGPPGKPIIGNALDIPVHNAWHKASQWAKQYGDIVYVDAVGQPIVYLNSFEVTQDLLEKRSSIYSDRGDAPMLKDLVGFDWNFAFMPHGDEWRAHRKIFHQNFNFKAVAAFQPSQRKHVHFMMRDMYEAPSQFYNHIKRLSIAIIMDAIYGLEIQRENDPYIKIADEALEYLTEAATPGAFLVDVFPSLKLVPEWFPGAGFKTKAKKWRVPVTKLATEPFNAAKRAFEAGKINTSLTYSWLDKLSRHPDEEYRKGMEKAISNVGGTAYVGGFETTSSTLAFFILAMMTHPGVQKRAHAELDHVVGSKRMPEYSDLANLPYLNAIYKEVLRWRPVVPLGVPHRATQDDMYKGMLIPKGCIILCNQWLMLRNEKAYGPDPDTFNPERFLKPGVPDPIAAFGFGRRICPGRYLADNTILMAIVSTLHLFDIVPKANAKEVHFTTGFLLHPKPFECDIRLRGSEALNLLETLERD
ncbi:cytochrome P450 [Mycena metata]|uniref:Cytochrome P450 n=1 Tax=Mycena metata TaxID=1033252 RepID=A0AAD7IUJ2_9AGAR|nr:cytochrome P450 [Mycena metata]